MIFGYICDDCEISYDVDQERDAPRKFDCPECGQPAGQDFSGIQFNTDCTFGYDENLEVDLRGRNHRQEVMREKGLTEYVPDPTMVKYREDLRRARKTLKGKEKADTLRQIRTEASTARRKRRIKDALAGTKDEVARKVADQATVIDRSRP